MSLLVVATVACDKDRLKVAEEDPQNPDDFSRTEFLHAAAANVKANSPTSFRAFAVRVGELYPSFSGAVRIEAERALVFMTIAHMEAVFDKSPAEQMEALALTVWPTALRKEPKAGETAAQFVERICADELALECKYVVAEYQPVFLSSLAWRNLKERAREAYVLCDVCARQPKYKQALASFDKHDRIMSARAGNVADDAHPRSWPFAGKSARRWSKVPVLAIDLDGSAKFRGRKTKAGKWRVAIARSDVPTGPLGVYLRPKDRVRTLRAVLEDAAAVGYREIALQVRGRKYPFRLAEYRLVTSSSARGKPRRKLKKLMIRDIDTIQVLVQSLDANTMTNGPPLGI